MSNLTSYRGRTGDQLWLCLDNTTTLAKQWQAIGENQVHPDYDERQRAIFRFCASEVLKATAADARPIT